MIAAAVNNNIGATWAEGVAGIGGGDAQTGTQGLRIMPLRVAKDTADHVSCATSGDAIKYAVDHGAQIINISYARPRRCAAEQEAIQRAYAKGIVIVAGAGNDNSNALTYPAAYGAEDNNNLVIAVAGLLPSGAKGVQSNYGPWVDLGAPYQRIRSLSRDGGYATDSGTSFSAPFVSGLLGLLMSNYDYSRDEAIAKVRCTATNIDAANPENFRGQLGDGRINAALATEMPVQLYLPMIQQ